MPHIHEKIDFTVEVYIVHKNKVLLRVHDKLKIWLSVGGHIELDEDPNQAAVREVKEEVGLDIAILDTRIYKENSAEYQELIPPQFLDRVRVAPAHEHVTFVYFATSETDEFVNIEGTESASDIRWFSREDLEDPTLNLLPNVKFYASKALETLGQ